MTDTDIDTARARWQKRIRELREAMPSTGKRPFSRYKLARLIDVSPSTIENWETDGTIPGGETIIRLAAYLPDGWTSNTCSASPTTPPRSSNSPAWNATPKRPLNHTHALQHAGDPLRATQKVARRDRIDVRYPGGLLTHRPRHDLQRIPNHHPPRVRLVLSTHGNPRVPRPAPTIPASALRRRIVTHPKIRGAPVAIGRPPRVQQPAPPNDRCASLPSTARRPGPRRHTAPTRLQTRGS